VCACLNDQEGVILQCVGKPLDELIKLLLVNQAQLGLIKQLTVQKTPPAHNLTAKFFDGLYIKKLVLQYTGIRQIDAHAFDGLANTLQDLNLAHNDIKEMPSDALNKLSSLLTIDMSNNSIGDLGAKHALPTLKKLFEINLGNNKIGDVHKSFFDNVKNNIQSINLGNNQLKNVPASGKSCKSLK
jgi:Leucine-rich repeat (LRR) protein